MLYQGLKICRTYIEREILRVKVDFASLRLHNLMPIALFHTIEQGFQVTKVWRELVDAMEIHLCPIDLKRI